MFPLCKYSYLTNIIFKYSVHDSVNRDVNGILTIRCPRIVWGGHTDTRQSANAHLTAVFLSFFVVVWRTEKDLSRHGLAVATGELQCNNLYHLESSPEASQWIAKSHDDLYVHIIYVHIIYGRIRARWASAAESSACTPDIYYNLFKVAGTTRRQMTKWKRRTSPVVDLLQCASLTHQKKFILLMGELDILRYWYSRSPIFMCSFTFIGVCCCLYLILFFCSFLFLFVFFCSLLAFDLEFQIKNKSNLNKFFVFCLHNFSTCLSRCFNFFFSYFFFSFYFIIIIISGWFVVCLSI